MKLALILQFCAFDMERARHTCALLERLEADVNEKVDFIFSVKKDARDLSHNRMIETIRRKFNVQVFQGNRSDGGWPDGPNAQWCETMLWVYDQLRQGKADWDYVFTTEPDIVPLCPDWLERLRFYIDGVFVAAKTTGRPLPVIGVVHSDHVNGNAIFPADWAMRHRMYGCPSGVAWDMHWAKINLDGAQDCPLMKNLYKVTEVKPDVLYAPRLANIEPVFVHGIKDDSGALIVADKFKLDLKFNPLLSR